MAKVGCYRRETIAMRLQGKVALITGAASGIGRESALLFAAEKASVVAVDIDEQGGRQLVADIEQNGGQAVFVKADVSKAADCQKMVTTAEQTFGKLNVLFNNAGIMLGADDDAISTPEDVREKTMAVNVKGVFWVASSESRPFAGRAAARSSTRRHSSPCWAPPRRKSLTPQAKAPCWP